MTNKLKRGRLSKKDQAFILDNKDNKTVAELASELNRSEKAVKKVLGVTSETKS